MRMDSITDFMDKDHRIIDALWKNAHDAANNQAWLLAQDMLTIFTQALLLHIDAEEDILFPAIEEKQGWEEGPTSFMRHEHKQIRYQLQQLEKLADTGEYHEFLKVGDLLTALLALHNSKEEKVLYPLCDQVMGIEHQEVLDLIKGRIGKDAHTHTGQKIETGS
ncbi:MAG: hemerythrin domain-containing protein [Pseudomonadota bacterium]|nr:hemerythrin domain-containing protein [Pseudomonadota bacterium]